MQEAELSGTFQRAPLLANDRNVDLVDFSLDSITSLPFLTGRPIN